MVMKYLNFSLIFDGDGLILTNDIDPSIIHIIGKYSLKKYKITYEMVDGSCPLCEKKLNKNGSVKV
jgi:hypothetical protein